MSPDRRVVKEWLKTVDREELDAMLQAAIFTPDEMKYIKVRLTRQPLDFIISKTSIGGLFSWRGLWTQLCFLLFCRSCTL